MFIATLVRTRAPAGDKSFRRSARRQFLPLSEENLLESGSINFSPYGTRKCLENSYENRSGLVSRVSGLTLGRPGSCTRLVHR